jgi:tetratricopeptide (TPR) repeat protein
VAACAGLGNVCLLQGDLERAASVLERGLGTDPGEPVGRLWPFVASLLGAAWVGLGRGAEALPLLEQAVERAAAMKLMANHPLRLVRLAEALLATDGPESAIALAARAHDQAEEQRERGHQAYALRLLGEVWAARDVPDLARTEGHYGKSLALAEQLGMRPLQGHCHLGLGRLRRRAGDHEGAERARAAARALFEDMDMVFWLRRAESVGDRG